jgi:hypothetical protein
MMRRRARGCQCGQWNRPIRQTGLPTPDRYRPRTHSKVHRLPGSCTRSGNCRTRGRGINHAGLRSSSLRYPLFAPELGPPAHFFVYWCNAPAGARSPVPLRIERVSATRNSFSFSRSWGEGARRVDEGSECRELLLPCCHGRRSKSALATLASPHLPFGHPLPVNGER